MRRTTRRAFLRAAGLGGLAAAVPPLAGRSAKSAPERAGRPAPGEAKAPFRLGLASYTFRAWGLDETIAAAARLGLSALAVKSVHLPLDATAEALASARAKARAAGLDLYGGGVIYMASEAEVGRAFAYARDAGMKMIIGVPDHGLLPLAAELVRTSGIVLAIHNHGPGDKLYPTPESVYLRVKGLARGVGLCLDVGHAARSGIDPAAAVEACFDRLYDVHVKDVTAADPAGAAIEIGRGVVDIPKLLRTLVRLGYGGALSLEYEKDEKDPLPGAAESVGYLRGVLAALA